MRRFMFVLAVSLMWVAASVAPAGGVPPVAPYKGLWLSSAEIQALPMAGSAWGKVKAAADGSLGTANVQDQDSKHDTLTLAVALVYQRTGIQAYRDKAAAAIQAAIGTERGGRTLALARNLPSYVIAADLINLPQLPGGAAFQAWLVSLRTEVLSDGKTLAGMREQRPNNWGTHGGAAVAALSLYLGDTTGLAREATVFKGWLGDRTAYAGFKYGDMSWQAFPKAPVGINPVGSTIFGHPVDGVLPDDQRRAGGFTWPPRKENYVWEALQGATVEAQLLARAGYPAWQWSDRAIVRAFTWLYTVCVYPPSGDDAWQPWLVDKATGSSFPKTAASQGKNMGWTDWTHA